MADGTKIEWAEATWNVITGCSVVSPGCSSCYAMRLAGGRLNGHWSREGLTQTSKAGPVWTGEVRFNEPWLDQPLRWRKPRLIFVCAHADLFHENVPDAWIDRVFSMMLLAPQHTFQVLTKRSARMRSYVTRLYELAQSDDSEWFARGGVTPVVGGWKVPQHIWLGVSAEDQTRADQRIPDLLETPAAVRWVSAEPLLGPIDTVLRLPGGGDWDVLAGKEYWAGSIGYRDSANALKRTTAKIDWVVAGGESGSGFRPMDLGWARDLRNQCEDAGTRFFMKQTSGETKASMPPIPADLLVREMPG